MKSSHVQIIHKLTNQKSKKNIYYVTFCNITDFTDITDCNINIFLRIFIENEFIIRAARLVYP